MADENKTFEAKKPAVDIQKWKERKLKSINSMTNQAKARKLAERVSRGGM